VSWVVIVFVSLTFCVLIGVTNETNQKVTNGQITTFEIVCSKTLWINLDHDGNVTDYRAGTHGHPTLQLLN
jgi:hypothetical protein